MENYISLMLAVLERAGILTYKEAEGLNKELRSSILPSTYHQASEMVGTLYDDKELKKLDERIDFSLLEGRILATREDLTTEIEFLRDRVRELEERAKKQPKAKVDTPS